MSTLLPSLISSILLTAVFAYLYRTDRERYLAIWAIAFGLWTARYAYGMVAMRSTFASGEIVLPLLALARATFILWGGFELAGRRLPKWWLALVGADALLLGGTHFGLISSPLPEGSTQYAIFGLATMWAGFLFVLDSHVATGERLFAGMNLALLGALNLIFPWSAAYPPWATEWIFGLVNFAQLGIGFAVLLVYFRITRMERDRLNRELQEHLTRVISGYVPICAHCKSVREGDEWSAIEKYVTERTDAAFSHSICPSCYDTRYLGEFGPAA